MSPTDVSAAEADEQLEIQAGRRAPYTQVGDWVALSTISPPAKTLYWVLSAHVNVSRGDREVWPSRATLAGMLGLAQARSVDPYLLELEQLGAVTTARAEKGKGATGPRRNVYSIHQTPPPGFSGHVSLSDWYRERREERAARTKAEATELVRSSAPPERVMQSSAPEVVRHSAPEVVRQTAHEQDVVTGDEGTVLSSSEAPPPREDVEQLCRRLRDRMIGNGCKPPTITDAWRTSARLLLDKDGRQLDKALNLIDWATEDEFWMANIQSIGKFRAQYDTLRMRALQDYQRKQRAAAPAGIAKSDARLQRQIEQHNVMFDEDGNFRADLALAPATDRPYALASASLNGAHR